MAAFEFCSTSNYYAILEKSLSFWGLQLFAWPMVVITVYPPPLLVLLLWIREGK